MKITITKKEAIIAWRECNPKFEHYPVEIRDDGCSDLGFMGSEAYVDPKNPNLRLTKINTQSAQLAMC